MSNQKALEAAARGFTESVEEVLASAIAVKGEQFGKVVAVLFNQTQLVEVLAHFAALAGEGKDEISSLSQVGLGIIGEVSGFAMETLGSEELANEAFELAKRLSERKGQTFDGICQ